MTTLMLLKAAVSPEKVVVPRGAPLLVRLMPVIEVEGVPEPESDTVRLFTVTDEPLRLLKRT